MHRSITCLSILLVMPGCFDPRDEPAPTQTVETSQGPLIVTTIAEGLDTVWAIDFSSDGRAFVTERPGRIRIIDAQGKLDPTPWATVPIHEQSESGLMGIALHPDFPDEPTVYMMATQNGATGPVNRILRLTEKDGKGTGLETVLDGIPAAPNHDGGRLKFGPDGNLYATTGDAQIQSNAQDPTSLSGKILRLTKDGGIPTDNPSPLSPIYTKGHRNPQGLCFHPTTGQLYASEHGPDTDDEINRIDANHNYGWPTHRGKATAPGFDASLIAWTPTIAPAGCAFLDRPGKAGHGDLFMVTLKQADLRRLSLRDGAILGEEIVIDATYGRLRDVVTAPDGTLWVGTSNKDGRGSPVDGDDRILRITVA